MKRWKQACSGKRETSQLSTELIVPLLPRKTTLKMSRQTLEKSG
jgi:hypothetical protein